MLRATLPASTEARWVLVGTFFSAVGRGLTLPFLLVYLTRVRGLDAGTVGLLVGWMGLVTLVLAPLGGSLVDRFGARRVVLPLLLVASLGSISIAFATNVVRAFLALTVVAIAFAALWAGQSTILASLVPPEAALPAESVAAPTDGTPVGAEAHSVRGTRARGGYVELVREKAFLWFVLFGLIVSSCGYAQIEVGFTAFSSQVAGVSPRVLAWAFAGNTLLIVGCQLFVLRWLEGRSRTRALALCAVIFAVSWSVLAGAGLAGGQGLAALAVAGVIGCSVIFAMGETLLSPVMPAITNALATDALRGRYNAVGVSSVFALNLGRHLTPAQDGRGLAAPPSPGRPPSQRSHAKADQPA